MKIKLSLTCGRCGGPYTTPWGHTCSMTLTKAAKKGGTPGLTYKKPKPDPKKKTPKKK